MSQKLQHKNNRQAKEKYKLTTLNITSAERDSVFAFVCLFVCVSVKKMLKKVCSDFRQNLVDGLGLGQGGSD